MTRPEINREVAAKVLRTVDAGLQSGLGQPVPGSMCVEAAVCYALGLPHSDDPKCVGSAVRAFKIQLNDSRWPSKADRAAGMRKLAIAQLGSDVIDQMAFAKFVAFECQKRILPKTMRRAASPGGKYAEELEAAAKVCESATSLDESKAATLAARAVTLKAREAANANAYAYAYAYADANAYAYAYAYANAYAYAYANAYAYADAYANAYAYADAYANAYADADAYANAYAYADAYANAYADAYANAYANADAFRHELLKDLAQIGLEALIALESPGCEWLDLCEAEPVTA